MATISNLLRKALLILLLTVALGSPRAWAEKNHAVVVGIDDYSSAGLQPLNNAENDARSIGTYFRSQGYEVTEILGSKGNGTKPHLDDVIAALARRISASDRIVLFFAGHGQTKEIANDKIGYFVMLPDAGSGQRNLVSQGDILRYSELLDRARHQLFIFDFCYGGLLGRLQPRGAFTLDGVPDDQLKVTMLSRKARQFLSAGGDNQEVLDGGPGELSWFTYFLLKGLEPGVVAKRENGLIIFTELAAYVMTNSANRIHTPATGSMFGHEGGDFLFLNTNHGKPPPPPLPTYDPQDLADLGFLTPRGESDRIRHELADMQRPIERLYNAWRTLDIDLYLAQLHPDVIQTYRQGGKRHTRTYGEIAAERRRLFPRLSHVDVVNYEVMYQGGDQGEAVFGVRYSMEFHFKSGRRPIKEYNVKECYKVRFSKTVQRWQIIRNDDYQRRICEYQ